MQKRICQLIALLLLGACQTLKEKDFIPLEARFSVPQRVVRIGNEVQFRQESSTEVIKDYLWEFGDAKTSTESEPKHAYTNIGTYKVRLTVKKENGTATSKIDSLTVIPNTITVSGTNTAQFGEVVGGLPNFSDEVGIKTILVNAGGNIRYYMMGRKNANGLLIIQTDANRNVIWQKVINNVANAKLNPTDIAYDSIPNGRKAIVIVGSVEYNETDTDSFIMSLDTQTGTEKWKYINSSTNSDAYNSLDIVENYYLVSGNSISRTQAGTSTKIKIDVFNPTNGTLELSENLNSPNTQVNDAKYIKLDNENILAGNDIGIERPAMLRYTSEQRNPIKTYLGNPTLSGKGLGITKLSNGQYVMVGELYRNSKDSTNAFIALFDANGQFLGMDILDIYKEKLHDVVEVESIGQAKAVVVVGTHYNPLSQKDILVARYTFEGNKPKREALRLIGGNLNEEATRLVNDGTNSVAILGTSQTLGLGFADMWFFKLNGTTLQ